MTPHQNQQFLWLEPLSYAWACGRISTRKVLFVAAILWVLLIILALALTTYTAQPDIQVDARLAIIIAVFCFAATWFVSRIPRNVHVYEKGIWIGKTLIPTARISSASVGAAMVRGKPYSILQFSTVNGRTYNIGLSHAIAPADLAKYLITSGMGRLPTSQS
jgi:hypothetical protein